MRRQGINYQYFSEKIDDIYLGANLLKITYLQHLGGFLPILKGRKTSKIKPEFVIFDPLRGGTFVIISAFLIFVTFVTFETFVIFVIFIIFVTYAIFVIFDPLRGKLVLEEYPLLKNNDWGFLYTFDFDMWKIEQWCED